MYEYNKKQLILITYLKRYICKQHLKMKPVMITMIERLENSRSITLKQLNSVINFLQRERIFTGMKRKDITQFFQVLIKQKTNKQEDTNHGITLDKFTQ